MCGGCLSPNLLCSSNSSRAATRMNSGQAAESHTCSPSTSGPLLVQMDVFLLWCLVLGAWCLVFLVGPLNLNDFVVVWDQLATTGPAGRSGSKCDSLHPHSTNTESRLHCVSWMEYAEHFTSTYGNKIWTKGMRDSGSISDDRLGFPIVDSDVLEGGSWARPSGLLAKTALTQLPPNSMCK